MADAFEEFDKIRGVFEAKTEGNLLDRQVRIAQEASSLEENTAIDDGEGRILGTFRDTAGEVFGTDVHVVSIVLHQMHACEFMLYHQAEIDIMKMCGLGRIDLEVVLYADTAFEIDEHDAHHRLQHLMMSIGERPIQLCANCPKEISDRALLLFGGDVKIGNTYESREKMIGEDWFFDGCLLVEEIGGELEDVALVRRLVEAVYLTGSNEEKSV